MLVADAGLRDQVMEKVMSISEMSPEDLAQVMFLLCQGDTVSEDYCNILTSLLDNDRAFKRFARGLATMQSGFNTMQRLQNGIHGLAIVHVPTHSRGDVNVADTVGKVGLGGAIGGAIVGTAFAGPLGTVVGGIVGGMTSAHAAHVGCAVQVISNQRQVSRHRFS